ncbi:MAG: serine hydrolase [Ruminococcus sp.]|nr:serine hydrolase [Ruminococcus sp.]MCM1478424.1 serine hydrolase [Muribaculaceae bacterium]
MNYRREKIIRIIVIIVSFAIIVGITVFAYINGSFLYPNLKKSEETGFIPNIVGYSYEEVRTAFAGRFDLEAAGEDYSDTFAAGAILSQEPAEGAEYIVGNTTVKVTVSKGAKPVETEVTTTFTEISTETEVTEETRVDGPIENPEAAFERSYPEEELELTAVGMDLPDGTEDLAEDLYAVLRRHGADAGFLYYNPHTGGSLEYNADEKFSSGSIIKAVYARSILDFTDLSAECEMTEETLNSPYELVNGEPVGTFFTVEELIRAALVKSDNTAYKMLYNYVGYQQFNEYAAGLGLPQRMTAENYWFRLTARESAAYFKEIYAFSRQHVNGEFMLECMANAEYRDMFSAVLADKTVHEKYGYLPQEDFYTLGDCAIVSGKNDYILVAYVRNTGENLDVQFFQDVAEITDKIHEMIMW